MYMIFVLSDWKIPQLLPYTGELHKTKQAALKEYLEAKQDPDVKDVYVTIV